jgi:23S rRNA pseudouridine2605 synthase
MKRNVKPHTSESLVNGSQASERSTDEKSRGEKIQKVLAQAGIGSRRTMEEWITNGRVSVNGKLAVLGMRVAEGDLVIAGHRSIRVGERNYTVRVLLYHKPEGEIVSRDDPEKRSSVFDKLPRLRGQKWIAIGRLDFNTSGLLIFTTSGELANRLMHPRFEIEREYAVRVQGTLSETQMSLVLKKGVELEDGLVRFEKLEDQGGEGFNHWYGVMLKEGRNRVVRRTFDALGLPVSRLIRIRFGIIRLPPRLKRGMTAELADKEVAHVLDWAGITAHPRQTDQASLQTDHARSKRIRHRTSVKTSTAGRAGSTRRNKSKSGVNH